MTTGNLSGEVIAGEETVSIPLPESKPKSRTQFSSGRAVQSHCRVVMREIGEEVLYEEVHRRLAKFNLPLSRAAFFRTYVAVFGHQPTEAQTGKNQPKPQVGEESIADQREEITADALQDLVVSITAKVADKPIVSIADPLKDFLRFCMMVESIGGVERARQMLDLMQRLGKIL